MSPYDKFNAELKHLLSEGCSTVQQVLQKFLEQHEELKKEQAQVLKHIQSIERELR